MRRREFIAGLGSAVAWPVVARGQQPNRVRRVGVLMANVESDPEAKARFSGFIQKLEELGWSDGRNLLMDVRWAGPDVDRVRMFAKELVGLLPDVIFAAGSTATAALQRETRTIPIVFVLIAAEQAVDGFVASLARPGGNITGFSDLEASMARKWLELLTEIAPGIERAGFMFDPDTGPYARLHFLPSFEAAARSLKVLPIVAPVHSDAEIETVMASLGREPGSGLVVITDAFVASHHALIISLAARNNVPAVFRNSEFVRDGTTRGIGDPARVAHEVIQ
jgi:putative ABC transport system substrate-binding protein